jgi:hypothetical protein
MFHAYFEDVEKAKAAATKEGWTEGESLQDFVEVHSHNHSTRRDFFNLEDAVNWLRGCIADKSVFGCGDVIQLEYCTCRGWRRTHRWIVTDAGIEEEENLEDDCWRTS